MTKAMVTLALFALTSVTACSTKATKSDEKPRKVRGASSAEFARVLDAKSPEDLREALAAIKKAHPDLKGPASYDSGHAFVDLDNPWIGQVTVDILPESGVPRGPSMFFFRPGCCDDPSATAKLVDAISKLDSALQPVDVETIDAVAGKVKYELGEHASFSTDGGFPGSLSICPLERGDVCMRLAKAIAAGSLPRPEDILPKSPKK